MGRIMRSTSFNASAQLDCSWSWMLLPCAPLIFSYAKRKKAKHKKHVLLPLFHPNHGPPTHSRGDQCPDRRATCSSHQQLQCHTQQLPRLIGQKLSFFLSFFL